MATDVELGREAYARRSWREAYAHFTKAARAAPLRPDDCRMLAIVANLIGSEDWADRWAGAYSAHLDEGLLAEAARCAGWLANGLFNAGQVALGGAWFGRAQEALAGVDGECAVHGMFMILQGMACFEEDLTTAQALFVDAVAIGRRHGDHEVMAIGQMGLGQAAVVAGDWQGALPALDAAMLIVTTEDVMPLVQGVVFCGVIDACQRVLELRRATEWTSLLSRWCDEQPDLVPFRGECLVHRAEAMQLHGDWVDALEEAARARAHLAGTPLVGEAAYREGELHRLRGAHREAEACYRSAAEAGRDPQPGLALLRLAQGKTDAAAAAIHRAIEESSPGAPKLHALAAAVEIFVAAEDLASAQSAADALRDIATELGVPFARALACMGEGRMQLATGHPTDALRVLREAWRLWRDLSVPYEAARGRFLLGLACRMAGDEEAAAMEFDAAGLGFAGLGASTALALLHRTAQRGETGRFAGLSPRELEVLRLVAGGLSNREVAAQLIVSEHTVARHVQNIFAKLGVNSRTAAAAIGRDHGVV